MTAPPTTSSPSSSPPATSARATLVVASGAQPGVIGGTNKVEIRVADASYFGSMLRTFR
jgi:hypothetical protein